MLITPPIGALGGLILSGLAFGSVSAARTAHPSKSSGWFDGLIQHDHRQHKHQMISCHSTDQHFRIPADSRIDHPHHSSITHPRLRAVEIMWLRIINRDYEMLRRSRTIERSGYEARVETTG